MKKSMLIGILYGILLSFIELKFWESKLWTMDLTIALLLSILLVSFCELLIWLKERMESLLLGQLCAVGSCFVVGCLYIFYVNLGTFPWKLLLFWLACHVVVTLVLLLTFYPKRGKFHEH